MLLIPNIGGKKRWQTGFIFVKTVSFFFFIYYWNSGDMLVIRKQRMLGRKQIHTWIPQTLAVPCQTISPESLSDHTKQSLRGLLREEMLIIPLCFPPINREAFLLAVRMRFPLEDSVSPLAIVHTSQPSPTGVGNSQVRGALKAPGIH